MKRDYQTSFDCSGNFVKPDRRPQKPSSSTLNTSASSANSSFFGHEQEVTWSKEKYDCWKSEFLQKQEVKTQYLPSFQSQEKSQGLKKTENLLGALANFSNAIQAAREKPVLKLNQIASQLNSGNSQNNSKGKILEPILSVPERTPSQQANLSSSRPNLFLRPNLIPKSINTQPTQNTVKPPTANTPIIPQAQRHPSSNPPVFNLSTNISPTRKQINESVPSLSQQQFKESSIQDYNMHQGKSMLQNLQTSQNKPSSLQLKPKCLQQPSTGLVSFSNFAQINVNPQSCCFGTLPVNLNPSQNSCSQKQIPKNHGISSKQPKHLVNQAKAQANRQKSFEASASFGGNLSRNQVQIMQQIMVLNQVNQLLTGLSLSHPNMPINLSQLFPGQQKVPSLFEPNSFHYVPDIIFQQEMEIIMETQSAEDFLTQIRIDMELSYQYLRSLCDKYLKQLQDRENLNRIILSFQKLDEYLPSQALAQKELALIHSRQNQIQNALNKLQRIFPEQYQNELSLHLRDYHELECRMWEFHEPVEQQHPQYSSILSLYESLSEIQQRVQEMSMTLNQLEMEFQLNN